MSELAGQTRQFSKKMQRFEEHLDDNPSHPRSVLIWRNCTVVPPNALSDWWFLSDGKRPKTPKKISDKPVMVLSSVHYDLQKKLSMAWQSSQICGLQYGKSSCCVTPKHPKVLLPEISWFEMHSSLTSEKKSCQKEIPTPLFSVQTDALSVIRCLHVSRLSIKVPAKKQEQRPLVFTRCDHITRRRTSFKSWKAFADIVLLQWTDFFSPVLGFWWCVMFIALRFKIIWDIKN